MHNASGFIEMLQFLFGDILQEINIKPVFKVSYHNDYTYSIQFESINNLKILSDIKELLSYQDKISGFGLAVIIALSEKISIGYDNTNAEMILTALRGNIITTNLENLDTEKSIQIHFTLDSTIFEEFQFSYNSLCNYLKQFAYLNSTLKIIAEDYSTADFQRNVYYFPKGIFEEIDNSIYQEDYIKPFMKLEIEGQNVDYKYQIGIAFSTSWLFKPVFKTYANDIETYLGGSLNDAILEGLIMSIKDIAQKENELISINKNNIKKQLIAIGSVRCENVVFYGSVKRTLGMPKLKKHIKQVVVSELTRYLNENPKNKKTLLDIFKKYED